jgi:hypothetical protein
MTDVLSFANGSGLLMSTWRMSVFGADSAHSATFSREISIAITLHPAASKSTVSRPFPQPSSSTRPPADFFRINSSHFSNQGSLFTLASIRQKGISKAVRKLYFNKSKAGKFPHPLHLSPIFIGGSKRPHPCHFEMRLACQRTPNAIIRRGSTIHNTAPKSILSPTKENKKNNRSRIT